LPRPANCNHGKVSAPAGNQNRTTLARLGRGSMQLATTLTRRSTRVTIIPGLIGTPGHDYMRLRILNSRDALRQQIRLTSNNPEEDRSAPDRPDLRASSNERQQAIGRPDRRGCARSHSVTRPRSVTAVGGRSVRCHGQATLDKHADWDGLQPVHTMAHHGPDVAAAGISVRASGSRQARPGRRCARAPGRSADGVRAAGQARREVASLTAGRDQAGG
jgi:hypothetical protein